MTFASPQDSTRAWNPRRLRDLMRLEITDSQHLIDGRLPSEGELMEQFGASRTAVREVLALLVEEGQIERRRGQGTSRVASYFSFDLTVPRSEEEIAAHARLVSRAAPVILYRGWTPAPAPIARRLTGVLPGEDCLALEYVFTSRGVPLAVITNHMRREEALLLDSVPFDTDFYTLLLRAGIPFADQSSTFQARRADADTARALDLPVGAPVLSFHQIIADESGEIFDVAFGTFRDDVRLTGRGTASGPPP